MLTQTVLPIVLAVFGVSLVLNMYRLVRGPSLADRILALDTLYINALATLIVTGIYFASADYFEVALLIGLFGFFGTVVLARFALRKRIVE